MQPENRILRDNEDIDILRDQILRLEETGYLPKMDYQTCQPVMVARESARVHRRSEGAGHDPEPHGRVALAGGGGMSSLSRAKANFRHNDRCRYLIDGVGFQHSYGVYHAALERGFVGAESTIKNRLVRGAATWAELLKPVNEKRASASKANAERKRAEMEELIAAMDARKAALK